MGACTVDIRVLFKYNMGLNVTLKLETCPPNSDPLLGARSLAAIQPLVCVRAVEARLNHDYNKEEDI